MAMDQQSESMNYEEEFILNSRGNKLFTCRWAPKEHAPKALIFICHGECSISMRGINTRPRLFLPDRNTDSRTNIQIPPLDWCEPDMPFTGLIMKATEDHLAGDATYRTSVTSSQTARTISRVFAKPENTEKKRFLYGVSMGGGVALLLHRKAPTYWDGAVLLAPMCKISDDMRPHPIVVSALKMLCSVAPSWSIIPTPDIIDKVCKDPEMRKQVRSNPYIYRGKLPLKTCHELLVVSLDIEKNLDQEASSSDKTFKLYPGMWHALTAELPDDVERVYSDIICWLDERADCTGSASETSGTPSV
uniref:Serine aminopeptidase S33 domain-containing protein n=1 Tax=Leersia perrieri TaxID=77586 RepID=A0A0D9V7J9_9ORYZ